MASILFRSAAEAELHEAFTWYEERESGLGVDFVQRIDTCLEVILRHPESYPVVHKNVRQAVIRRFPYSLFYFISGETIVVLSVFHASRSPMIWQRRARFQ